SCWATKLGYPCCKDNSKVIFTDADGRWNVENGDWCGVVDSSSCWATKLGYNCCTSNCPIEYYADDDGSWGVENNNWCGIIKSC
ncbi:hypothetical protein LY90DRAFT_372237, partial [Neocallimastix californiae]